MNNSNDDLNETFLNENEDSELMINELKMFEVPTEEKMKIYNSTKRLIVATETYVEELKTFLTTLEGEGKSEKEEKCDEITIPSIL